MITLPRAQWSEAQDKITKLESRCQGLLYSEKKLKVHVAALRDEVQRMREDVALEKARRTKCLVAYAGGARGAAVGGRSEARQGEATAQAWGSPTEANRPWGAASTAAGMAIASAQGGATGGTDGGTDGGARSAPRRPMVSYAEGEGSFYDSDVTGLYYYVPAMTLEEDPSPRKATSPREATSPHEDTPLHQVHDQATPQREVTSPSARMRERASCLRSQGESMDAAAAANGGLPAACVGAHRSAARAGVYRLHLGRGAPGGAQSASLEGPKPRRLLNRPASAAVIVGPGL